MPRLNNVTLTPQDLVHLVPLRNEFTRPLSEVRKAVKRYQRLLAGTTRRPDTATLALPALPQIGGRSVHSIWPTKSHATNVAQTPTSDIEGEMIQPRIQGADGIPLHFTTRPGSVYNLLQCPGFRMNGGFRSWGRQETVLNKIGLLLLAPAGYSRVEIRPQADQEIHTQVNGLPLEAGQSIRLADGGLLHASRDARHIYVNSTLAPSVTLDIHHSKSGPLLNLRLGEPLTGDHSDSGDLQGMLAPTLQGISRARHLNAAGEELHGPIEEFRVNTGLFGAAPDAPQIGFLPSDDRLGAVYQHYFNWAPQLPVTALQPQDIAEQWQWINQQSVQLELIQNAASRERKLREQERKQELLLLAALKGGNIDMAILLLASTETQSSNELTRRLVLRIHQLQKQRQSLSAQMAKVGNSETAEGSSQLQSLVTESANIATEISLLQTFLQDAVASKRNIQEFASNWIQQSYQTTRSIIQSIGR